MVFITRKKVATIQNNDFGVKENAIRMYEGSFE